VSEHTPGPWIEVGRYIETDRHIICEMFSAASREERDANQRLIAAAPELLEALKALMHEVDESGNGYAKDFGWPVAVGKARAAIAKAEEVKP